VPRLNRATIENHLLSLLPGGETNGEAVMLGIGDTVYEPGKPQDYVYFPSGCVLALFGLIKGRTGLGVGLVGREGMVGIGLALGATTIATRILVQSPGMALRMRASCLRRQFMENPREQWQFFRYAYLSMLQARQVAVCSNFHETVPRLVRWLLLTGDRTAASEFDLTQEYLACMLGVRRASVTEAARVLQKRTLIDYSRGRIRILDRKGLESACCTCYQAIKRVEQSGASRAARPSGPGAPVFGDIGLPH
jgi:CRP-like cAMP-binding protein